MSNTYPEFLLTNYPDKLDTLRVYLDLSATEKPYYDQYVAYISSGDFSSASELLVERPNLKKMIFLADDMNYFAQAILAIQKMFKYDIDTFVMGTMVMKGEWSEASSYVKYNVVTYEIDGVELWYSAITDTVPKGTLPTDTTYWKAMTIQGQRGVGIGLTPHGAWYSTEAYVTNDLVSYNNEIWYAIADSYNVQPGTDELYWLKFQGLVTEGYENTVQGLYAHAEGSYNNSSAECSHTEGSYNTASGLYSHAQNYGNTASGAYSSASGNGTTASGMGAISEGLSTLSGSMEINKTYTIINTTIIEEGTSNTVILEYNGTTTSGDYTYLLALNTENNFEFKYLISTNDDGVYETNKFIVIDSQLLPIFSASKNTVTVFANTSTLEGTFTFSYSYVGTYCKASGNNTNASADYAIATGSNTSARGINSYSGGVNTISVGAQSFTIGNNNVVIGENSFSTGKDSYNSGDNSASVGEGLISVSDNQFITGMYNDNAQDNLFEIGNGTSDTERNNVFEITKTGVANINGEVNISGSINVNDNQVLDTSNIIESTTITEVGMLMDGATCSTALQNINTSLDSKINSNKIVNNYTTTSAGYVADGRLGYNLYTLLNSKSTFLGAVRAECSFGSVASNVATGSKSFTFSVPSGTKKCALSGGFSAYGNAYSYTCSLNTSSNIATITSNSFNLSSGTHTMSVCFFILCFS